VIYGIFNFDIYNDFVNHFKDVKTMANGPDYELIDIAVPELSCLWEWTSEFLRDNVILYAPLEGPDYNVVVNSFNEIAARFMEEDFDTHAASYSPEMDYSNYTPAPSALTRKYIEDCLTILDKLYAK